MVNAIFIIVALIITVSGGGILARNISDISASQTAVATVTGYRTLYGTSSRRAGTAYFPQLTYSASDGRQVLAESRSGSGVKKFEVGQQVSVWYRISQPEKVHIKRYSEVYVFPGLMVVVGLAMLGAGIFHKKKPSGFPSVKA